MASFIYYGVRSNVLRDEKKCVQRAPSEGGLQHRMMPSEESSLRRRSHNSVSHSTKLSQPPITNSPSR